jgi:hypothetical protein
MIRRMSCGNGLEDDEFLYWKRKETIVRNGFFVHCRIRSTVKRLKEFVNYGMSHIMRDR